MPHRQIHMLSKRGRALANRFYIFAARKLSQPAMIYHVYTIMKESNRSDEENNKRALG
jgi:hypothetical protein